MEQFQPIDFNLIPLSGSRFTPLIKDLPLILQTHSQSLPVTKKPSQIEQHQYYCNFTKFLHPSFCQVSVNAIRISRYFEFHSVTHNKFDSFGPNFI